MKVLISGASGFIGNRVAEFLGSKGYDIITLGRKKNKDLKTKHIFFDLLSPDVDYGELKQIKKCDAIVHCSSVMANKDNVDDIQLLLDNIKMSQNILEIAKLLSVKHFINLSSIAVYPSVDGTYSEQSQLKTSDNNDCIYGLSKICAENIFDYLLLKKGETKVTHLRISMVYGPGMRQDRTYAIMKKELEKRNQITVWNNGERVSNFIYVDEVVKAINFFLSNPEKSGIYNLGGQNLSFKELAEDLIKKYGNANSRIILLDKGNKSKFYLDTSKINKLCLNE